MQIETAAVQIISLNQTTGQNGQPMPAKTDVIVGKKARRKRAVAPEGTPPSPVPHQIEDPTDPETTKADAARLSKLEREIAAKARSFVALGHDLKEIRDRRLYRVRSHETFDTYCRERWAMTRRYADLMISAAEVYDLLRNNCSDLPLPTNESQCRALARLGDPQQQIEVWKKAVEAAGGKPATAEAIRAVIAAQATGSGAASPINGDPTATASLLGTSDSKPCSTERPDLMLKPTIRGNGSNDSSGSNAAQTPTGAGEPEDRSGDDANEAASPPADPAVVLETLTKVVRVLEHLIPDVETIDWRAVAHLDHLKWVGDGIVAFESIRDRITCAQS